MQTPLIHLNGSGSKNLLEGYRAAAEAVSAALEALYATRPHGRDYYPLGDGVKPLADAVREHEARIEKLRAVESDLVALYEAVQAQAK